MDLSRTDAKPIEITGIRPDVVGVYLSIRCRKCAGLFETYQTTIAGLAFGNHSCPLCRADNEIQPEDFANALDRFLPAQSQDAMVNLSNEASRIAENWYRREPFATLLTFKGVNLGEPTERFLLSYITLGLFAAQRQRGQQ
jgi:phage FluMu protein Com